MVGISHLGRNIPCQDAHRHQVLANGWTVAAVADGVGSAKHSEIASKMACDVVVETCEARVTEDTKFSEAKRIMTEAYQRADREIKDYVSRSGDLIMDYDTTLSAVIYDGERVAYGHSGDGGIVVLTNEGDYVKVTLPQKEDDNTCVVPLRAGESHWVFGEFESTSVASVLLATDGVYDNLMPYLLRGQEVEFYIPLIRWFMDNNIIGITEETRQEVEESRRIFLSGENCRTITDDKTVLVVFNAEIMPKLKEDSFYKEPDWAQLQENWRRKAYPHLYKEKDTDQKKAGTIGEEQRQEGNPGKTEGSGEIKEEEADGKKRTPSEKLHMLKRKIFREKCEEIEK